MAKHSKYSPIKIITNIIFLFSILCVCVPSAVLAELKIESVYPTLGKLGEDLEVTLTGTGFDDECSFGGQC